MDCVPPNEGTRFPPAEYWLVPIGVSKERALAVHPQISLKTIGTPAGAVVSAPPILNASDHTVDFTCGNCGTVLLYAEEGQVHNVTILCAACGSYNLTDG